MTVSMLHYTSIANAMIDEMLGNADIKKEIDINLIQRLMADRIFVGKISHGDGMKLVRSDWFDEYAEPALLKKGNVKENLEHRFEELKEKGIVPKDAHFNKKWAVYVLGTLGLTAAGALYGAPLGILPTVAKVTGALESARVTKEGAEAGAALGIGASAATEVAIRGGRKFKNWRRHQREHGGGHH